MKKANQLELSHREAGQTSASKGNYDEARQHFYHADRLRMLKNKSLRGSEIGLDHTSSDHVP